MSRSRRHNASCSLSGMRCVCFDRMRYERLSEFVETHRPQQSSSENKDLTNEKEEELIFHNDDGNFNSILVERNLCTSDLCQLLALKNRVAKSEHWSLVEYWVDLGLERLLEDHEYVLSAYRNMRSFSPHIQFKFIFRKDFRKYEFFHHPQQFFPPNMIDFENTDDMNSMLNNPLFLQNLVSQDGKCPIMCSDIWLRENKKSWSKAYLLLKDRNMYVTYKSQVLTKYIRALKSKPNTNLDPQLNGLAFYATLADYYIYTTLNAKNQFSAPTEWGICLRPSGDTEDETPVLRCLCCASEQVRTCWVTAMRLAKYGKQLRENYRAFKNKQSESINTTEYNSSTYPTESVRSRVAMDFTGSVGRIVEDPKEAKAIAVAEGYSWKRRLRPTIRAPPNAALLQGIESGVHITQPWFHSGMSRDQATALVNRHGTVDGVFLVRESRSYPGAFVLTYKCGAKVLHAQITPLLDQSRDTHVFSLDSGVTKFYDLLQLVEFYQLNEGCLPTRLTHYVVQNLTPLTTVVNTTPPTPPQQHHAVNGE